jgi:hypothetical protein
MKNQKKRPVLQLEKACSPVSFLGNFRGEFTIGLLPQGIPHRFFYHRFITFFPLITIGGSIMASRNTSFELTIGKHENKLECSLTRPDYPSKAAQDFTSPLVRNQLATSRLT